MGKFCYWFIKSGPSTMNEGVLHCLRQLFVQENQYRQCSRGDQLVVGGFFVLIKVNNLWEGLVSAVRSIGPLWASLINMKQNHMCIFAYLRRWPGVDQVCSSDLEGLGCSIHLIWYLLGLYNGKPMCSSLFYSNLAVWVQFRHTWWCRIEQQEHKKKGGKGKMHIQWWRTTWIRA